MDKKGCFLVSGIILFILALCFCVMAVFIVTISSTQGITEDPVMEEALQRGNSNQKIAVIDIEGVILSDSTGLNIEDDMVARIIKKLERVQNDDSFKAVILRINTPGGTVFDSDKIAKEIIQTKEAGKKVVALMEESATSGGYYVAAPADKIIASEVTLTGSIGVVTQIIELDGLYEKLGVDVINVTNTEGEVKTFENLEDPQSKDRAVLEEVLDDNFDSFIDMIDSGRTLNREEILALADGSIYSGKKALELGLVDELGGIDEAISSASELAELDNPEVIELTDPVDFFDELFGPTFMKSLGIFSQIGSKVNVEPGVYSWYIVAP